MDEDELARALGRAVVSLRPVAGGSLNAAYAAELEGGERVFVKTRADAAPGEFATEAEGLRWLADAGALRIAEVVAVGGDWLALRWIEAGRLDAAGEEELGRGLAELHRAGAPAFGGPRPLRIGPLELPNDESDDWPSFYAAARLRAARATARASATWWAASARGSTRSPGRRSRRRACTATSGAATSSRAPTAGRGSSIPAAYGGHREVDLAMLQLFGSPSPRTLAAYDEVWPRADGHEERLALYQLFPLLVHAVLFGGGYVASAEEAARRYG